LSPEEIRRAEAVGEARRKLTTGPEWMGNSNPDDPAEQDRAGAAAELAVAIALGVEWNPDPAVSDGGKPDVGIWHVRSTKYANGHLLLYNAGPTIKKADPPGGHYVLVTGTRPHLTLAAWCYGYEGKLPHYWRTDCRQPCYWVPQSAMRPVRAEKLEAWRGRIPPDAVV
jgi:hypothetical protein